ncbi:class I SAM-dependent methyltransferase [Hyphobacterium sp. CCMP332]|nr:class I SAM-dependent methyltransferase [Hyphobacterium sp. CCMP332]
MNLYQEKDKSYFSNVRIDLISLLNKRSFDNLLEIGAGGGASLIYVLENSLAKKVNGIDITKLDNAFQNDPRIENFWIGNIENEDFGIAEKSFDCIICADVLEHLVDPWTAMQKIERWLKPDGLFLLSIPNIREISSLSKIFFKGRFEYRPEGGIMDKTHLRFFCRKDVIDLVAGSDLKIISVMSNFQTVHDKSWRTIFNKLTFRLFEEFLTVQHFVIAIKK